MPTPTYVALAKTVLTGTQATITFSSISGTYTDLLLVLSCRDNNAGTYQSNGTIKFNGTTANYSDTYLRATGTSVTSARDSNRSNGYLGITVVGDSATANTFSNIECYIANYASSTNKSFSVTGVGENNNATSYNISPLAGLWQNSAAITSIDITASGSFVSGSRFDLYGIKNS